MQLIECSRLALLAEKGYTSESMYRRCKDVKQDKVARWLLRLLATRLIGTPDLAWQASCVARSILNEKAPCLKTNSTASAGLNLWLRLLSASKVLHAELCFETAKPRNDTHISKALERCSMGEKPRIWPFLEPLGNMNHLDAIMQKPLAALRASQSMTQIQQLVTAITNITTSGDEDDRLTMFKATVVMIAMEKLLSMGVGEAKSGQVVAKILKTGWQGLRYVTEHANPS